KNLNYLLESGFIQKDEQFFKISQSGKLEYSKMLRNYDLDRQTILEEESKRVDDITANTTRFFDKYNINDEDIKFRFLNKVLKFSYSKVSSILTEEEDFFKILLFISINHPSYYPNYISIEDFSELYDIKKKVLDFWIDEIVLGRIFDNKIYRIETSRDKYYFFESNEKLEKILRAITEEHVTKHRYLEKFGRFESNEMLISNILNEICELLFNKDLRSSLQYFLPEYIKHLAYKIEIKRKLLDTYDKLEGIIWQNMATIFNSEGSEKLEDQYREDIKEINRSIAVNPKNYELYNEKIRILIYFNQYTELLNLLDEIIKYFPEKEIELLMKKASVLKLKQDINAGLGIIEDLIGKHPDNLELKNYKAYWLQYLGKKEEAIEILNQLIKADPENAIYHDTFGEILMNFNEFEEAAKKFLKAIVLDNAGWFIYQTYIKLGSCYLALEKFDLAEKNLKTGKEKVEEYVKDLDTRQNWLAIADLLLMEIREQKS
ncbi:MAG: tetratricopeptide repeat protein, partial [Candidatus Thorarchaeota archaeon]